MIKDFRKHYGDGKVLNGPIASPLLLLLHL